MSILGLGLEGDALIIRDEWRAAERKPAGRVLNHLQQEGLRSAARQEGLKEFSKNICRLSLDAGLRAFAGTGDIERADTVVGHPFVNVVTANGFVQVKDKKRLFQAFSDN